MVKRKFYALASVSAIAGAMTATAAVGCSTSTTQAPAGPDARADRTVVPEDAEPASNCPQNVALTVADLDQEIGFKPATRMPGACTQADLTKLEANFKDTTIATYFDLGNGLSDACKPCILSKDTDNNWQPIVGTAENGGETGFINFGACFGAVEGEACGKALQYEQFCYGVACNKCATTSGERQQCVQEAEDGMCKDFGAATGTACPKLQDTLKSCNTVFDAVTYLCTTAGDGGTDGGN